MRRHIWAAYRAHMTPWQWIQANTWWMTIVLVGSFGVLLTTILFAFWRNRHPEYPACPPLDQAVMELPDDVIAMYVQKRSDA